MSYRALIEKARAIPIGTPEREEERAKAVRILMADDRFPALMSMLLETEEDMTVAVSSYNRSHGERTMDAGGLATLRKFLGTLEVVLTPEAKLPEPPTAPGMKR